MGIFLEMSELFDTVWGCAMHMVIGLNDTILTDHLWL